jgi:hypothetical protein
VKQAFETALPGANLVAGGGMEGGAGRNDAMKRRFASFDDTTTVLLLAVW